MKRYRGLVIEKRMSSGQWANTAHGGFFAEQLRQLFAGFAGSTGFPVALIQENRFHPEHSAGGEFFFRPDAR